MCSDYIDSMYVKMFMCLFFLVWTTLFLGTDGTYEPAWWWSWHIHMASAMRQNVCMHLSVPSYLHAYIVMCDHWSFICSTVLNFITHAFSLSTCLYSHFNMLCVFVIWISWVHHLSILIQISSLCPYRHVKACMYIWLQNQINTVNSSRAILHNLAYCFQDLLGLILT